MIKLKANEVMNLYKISRGTLTNWIKRGLLKTEKLPNGRYVYLVDEKEFEDDDYIDPITIDKHNRKMECIFSGMDIGNAGVTIESRNGKMYLKIN